MWPQFLHEQWTNPVYYNFWSSEAGGLVVSVGKILGLLIFLRVLWPRIWKHFECDVEAPNNCHRRGYRVGTTGHKACGEHHPDRHDKTTTPTTADDILYHHEKNS